MSCERRDGTASGQRLHEASTPAGINVQTLVDEAPLFGEGSLHQIKATAYIKGDYRYRLTRSWGRCPADGVLWIMLNPSTATAVQDDPTIKRCKDFTRRWGFEHMAVVNLFALRASNPRALLKHDDPVGELNDGFIAQEAARAQVVVAAWGNGPAGRDGEALVRARAYHVAWTVIPSRTRIQCLGQNASGQPKHPLYIATGAKLKLFTERI